MIRRLIILLLIVGCKDEEEPMGLCYFLTQLDNMTAESFSNGEDPFHWECKNSYTKSECCEDITAEGICPAAYNFICYGGDFNVDGSNNLEFPQSWIWKKIQPVMNLKIHKMTPKLILLIPPIMVQFVMICHKLPTAITNPL